MKKPRKCPNCGSKSIAEILHGMPAYSEDLQKKMDEGKIVLGGCCVTDNDPQFQCNDCHAQIFEDGSFELSNSDKP